MFNEFLILKKRKKTVTKNNQIVDKNKKEVEPITKTPYKAKSPAKSPAKTTTKTLSNTQPKIAKTPAKTPSKVQNNKNTTTKTPAKTVKTSPVKNTNTSPNKTTKSPSPIKSTTSTITTTKEISPTKKTTAKTNLKSKRPVKKSKKTNNNPPLEFRISTEEEFKNHFQLVRKNEFGKNMNENRTGIKGNYMFCFYN
jgi:hypothetical protein